MQHTHLRTGEFHLSKQFGGVAPCNSTFMNNEQTYVCTNVRFVEDFINLIK